MTGGRLSVEVGFGRWASSYEHENPLTELDRRAARRLVPAPSGGALLDVGCGTGRRLPRFDTPEGPGLVVGLDLVPEMLFRGRNRMGASRHLVLAALEEIPLRPGLFDAVWCRLTIGFVRELEPAMSSLAGQLRCDGRLLITDLHPDLAEEGAERGFLDDDGRWTVIESSVHPVERMLETARLAGLELEDRLDLEIGPELAPAYEAAGRDDLYREHSGRPVLLGLSLRLTRGRRD